MVDQRHVEGQLAGCEQPLGRRDDAAVDNARHN
jgi:hypothetical protein